MWVEHEMGPGPRTPQRNGQSFHPQLFLLPPSRVVVIDSVKQDQPQVGPGLGGCREQVGWEGVTQTFSVSLADSTESAL